MSTLSQIEKLNREKIELTKDIVNLSQGSLRLLAEARLANIDIELHKLNQNNSDYIRLMDFLFQNEVSEVKASSLTLYKPLIALTYAPPQVGKTNAMINIVKECVTKGISVVISSDNKKDQMSQLFSRLIKAVEKDYETIFEHCFITTVDNKNFDTLIDEMKTKKSFVICCLDNKSQIQKVHEKISAVHEQQALPGLCLIHDEADVITKARNITEVMISQPESHKKWIELTQNLYLKGIAMKRVFVTATPENVVYLHKPGFVWELPVPDNYVSYSDFEFTELNAFDKDTITRILTREAKRRREEGGIILYCVERNKEESNEEDTRSNQSQVFLGCMNTIRKTGLDAVTMYNSDGFKLSFRLQKHKTLFMNKMEELAIQYFSSEDGSFTIKKNELAICEFYGHLQSSGCKVVLTIGKDLISRGISFVSNHTQNPLTATTMIYKPGDQLSQVALTQAIGRLNGTAQPNLKRRLYTTDDVYENFTTFMNNQREIMSAIQANGKKVDDELISEIALWKASRSVDRKTLKLEQDMTFWEDSQAGSEDEDGYVSDDDKMRNLIDKWWREETILGKILKLIYKSGSVDEKTLKDFIKINGSKNAQGMFEHLTNSSKNCHLIFKRNKNNDTSLYENVTSYIRSQHI